MNGSPRSRRLGLAALLLVVLLAEGGRAAPQQGVTSVVKGDSPDPARVGGVLTYTLTVSGVADRNQYFTVTDRLPSGLLFVSGVVSRPGKRTGDCVPKGSTVICDLLVLEKGEEKATIFVIPTRTGRIRNVARATPYDCDVDIGCPPSAVSRGVSTRVSSPLDVSIDAPQLTPAREELLYRLTVTNCDGCAPIVQAVLTDVLPAGVTFVSASFSTSSSKGTCTETAGKVSCAVGNLADGARVTADVVVVPRALGDIENKATVSGAVKSRRGSIPVSDGASLSSTVAGANLALELTGTPQTVAVGQKVAYALTVQNLGPVPASNVTVIDTLPLDVTFDSAQSSQLCSRAAGRTVVCKLSSVANGQSAKATIVGTPTAVGPITNRARVRTSTLDTDRSNDSDTEVTTVQAAADLSVAVSGKPDPVEVGERLTYTLDIRNAGPSDASGVVLTSRLQGNVTSLSSETSRGSCLRAGQIVTCRLGTIAKGAGATVTIEVTPESAGTVVNRVDVNARTAESNRSDNTRAIKTKVRPAAKPPSISIADVELKEDEDAAFRVTLSEPASTQVRVAYETGDGTATEASGDYEQVSGALVFAPGETEQTIAVTVGDDPNDEPDETFNLRLFRPEGVSIGDAQGQARILDNDEGRPSVSVEDVRAQEGNPAIFEVKLSEPASAQVSVTYETVDGTATAAGGDYERASGTLVFAPGETEQTIAVTIADDSRDEADETFRIRLLRRAGGRSSIGDPEARATILDDDADAPTLSIEDVEVEEGEPLIVEVMLSAPATRQVRVGYKTLDGTARAASGDYEAVSGTLAFAPGESEQTIAVNVADDSRNEGDETVEIRLAGAVGATIGDRRGRAVIVDNDDVASSLSIEDVEAKGSEPVVFVVTVSESADEPVRVDYRTVDGTATAESGDYEPVSGTLLFAPGQTDQTITVAIGDDGPDEDDETFRILLANVVGASIGDAEGEALIIADGGQPIWVWLVVAFGAAGLLGAMSVVLRRVLRRVGSGLGGLIPTVVPFTPRYLNLAVTDEHQDVLENSRTLVPEREYHVRIDIGALDSASLVENPMKAEPGKPEPSLAGGHWLEVVLVSGDVDVTQAIHRLFLPFTHRSWVCSCIGPDHVCEEPERARYLYVPIRTQDTTSDAIVRCTVYQQNNVLQSASLHLVVADGTDRPGAQRAVVDYTLSRHFAEIGTLSPRLINILTNESFDGTHRIVVKDDSKAIAVDLTEGAVRDVLDAVRTELKRMSLGPSGDVPQYDDDNSKPASELIADLKKLALLGSVFWSAVVPRHDDRLYLRERLRQRATIQVSRVTKVVFPWAVVYDIPREAQASWTLCPLLASWDEARGKLDGYPDACPHESEHHINVLCPYGFWGFRHVIEQPPSVRQGVLKTTIHVADTSQAVLARSLELDEDLSERHLTELRACLGGRFRVSECESRDALRAALADPALPLVYFYCHGKWGVLGDTSLRVPFLEIGHSDLIGPHDFAAWSDEEKWDEKHWGDVSPLIFINGCHTVELSPEGVVNFVEALAGMNAAGVVGTEIAVSQMVASEVAERFYRQLTGTTSQSVGTALYRVRIDLLRKGNVTGLIYTPFCSTDLALGQRAV